MLNGMESKGLSLNGAILVVFMGIVVRGGTLECIRDVF
ncbi:hypothetical protein TERTU_4109 [Teredinibacter turnerae T7901]|uniref:Uncharacterized protein n=1 Tax=Teredinibacter turnerae (strain ATCC 39867 / T7901) TaxID=377629 RepID=C5BUG2_TERTT|nr:hypothetical protein TERTU_4109 [Teredinibacter turnerae T7901]